MAISFKERNCKHIRNSHPSTKQCSACFNCFLHIAPLVTKHVQGFLGQWLRARALVFLPFTSSVALNKLLNLSGLSFFIYKSRIIIMVLPQLLRDLSSHKCAYAYKLLEQCLMHVKYFNTIS